MGLRGWWPVVIAPLVLAGCGSDSPGRPAAPVAPSPPRPYAVQLPPVPDIGLRVAFTPWPPTKPVFDPTLGPALLDIRMREPPAESLSFPDAITLGHETTHAINNAIRNAVQRQGPTINAFYVMNGWCAIVTEPNVRKSQIAALVPQSLRNGRYSMYLLGQPGWENVGLHLWDEWDAYTNGATVAIDRYARGLERLPPGTLSDDVFAVLEFTVYALTTGMAVGVYDPVRFATDSQLRAFLAWQTERAMGVFRTGIVLPSYQWAGTDAYYAALRASPDAEPLREFARATFGAVWAYAVLGI